MRSGCKIFQRNYHNPSPPSRQQTAPSKRNDMNTECKKENNENYVLDIHQYSFHELLQLFDITNASFSLDDLKYAKRKVLLLHPDKSRLEPAYFLFYKKAYDILANHYKNNHKIEEDVSIENPNTQYNHISRGVLDDTFDKNMFKKINSTMKEMSPTDFNNRFNNLFETSNLAKKPDPKQNEWFSSSNEMKQHGDPRNEIYQQYNQEITGNNMNQVMEKMKSHLRNEMVLFQNTQELYSSSFGNNYYEDDDEPVEDNTNKEKRPVQYLQCDPFSKLKFEDLRKVHKDQTVFAVGETDFHKVKQYKNVNAYKEVRERDNIVPISAKDGERMLLEQQQIWKETMMRKQHADELKRQKNAEASKNILSSFLQIQN